MSSLFLKVLGARYQIAIDRLERTFQQASAPFRAEILNVVSESEAFAREVSEGRASWVASYPDGEIWSYEDEFAERREDAEDALSTLRQTFAMAVYHRWERMAKRWTPQSRPTHEQMVAAAKAQGLPLDEPGLDVLRALTNTIKHDSAVYGGRLFSQKPDCFVSGFAPGAGQGVWVEHLAISDDHFEEFLVSARASAPR